MKHMHGLSQHRPLPAYYVGQGPFMDLLGKVLPEVLRLATQNKQPA